MKLLYSRKEPRKADILSHPVAGKLNFSTVPPQPKSLFAPGDNVFVHSSRSTCLVRIGMRTGSRVYEEDDKKYSNKKFRVVTCVVPRLHGA